MSHQSSCLTCGKANRRAKIYCQNSQCPSYICEKCPSSMRACVRCRKNMCGGCNPPLIECTTCRNASCDSCKDFTERPDCQICNCALCSGCQLTCPVCCNVSVCEADSYFLVECGSCSEKMCAVCVMKGIACPCGSTPYGLKDEAQQRLNQVSRRLAPQQKRPPQQPQQPTFVPQSQAPQARPPQPQAAKLPNLAPNLQPSPPGFRAPPDQVQPPTKAAPVQANGGTKAEENGGSQQNTNAQRLRKKMAQREVESKSQLPAVTQPPTSQIAPTPVPVVEQSPSVHNEKIDEGPVTEEERVQWVCYQLSSDTQEPPTEEQLKFYLCTGEGDTISESLVQDIIPQVKETGGDMRTVLTICAEIGIQNLEVHKQIYAAGGKPPRARKFNKSTTTVEPVLSHESVVPVAQTHEEETKVEESHVEAQGRQDHAVDESVSPEERKMLEILKRNPNENFIQKMLLDVKGVPGFGKFKKEAKRQLKTQQLENAKLPPSTALAPPPQNASSWQNGPPAPAPHKVVNVEHGTRELLRTSSGQYMLRTASGHYLSSLPENADWSMAINTDVVGWIIGKNGNKLQELKTDHGLSSLWVHQRDAEDNLLPFDEPRYICAVGKTPALESLRNALIEIFASWRFAADQITVPPLILNTSYTPQPVKKVAAPAPARPAVVTKANKSSAKFTTKKAPEKPRPVLEHLHNKHGGPDGWVEIDRRILGRVIGKGGSGLKDIERQCGVRHAWAVQHYPDGTIMPPHEPRRICLWGDKGAVEKAEVEVNARIKDALKVAEEFGELDEPVPPPPAPAPPALPRKHSAPKLVPKAKPPTREREVSISKASEGHVDEWTRTDNTRAMIGRLGGGGAAKGAPPIASAPENVPEPRRAAAPAAPAWQEQKKQWPEPQPAELPPAQVPEQSAPAPMPQATEVVYDEDVAKNRALLREFLRKHGLSQHFDELADDEIFLDIFEYLDTIEEFVDNGISKELGLKIMKALKAERKEGSSAISSAGDVGSSSSSGAPVLCSSCQAQKPDALLHPCNHRVLCMSCAGAEDGGSQIIKCPACKTKVETVTRLFIT